jgi:hypothetical protein
LKINRDQVRYRIEKFGLRAHSHAQPSNGGVHIPAEDVAV